MLRGLIAFCLLRRPLVLVAFAAFLGLGFAAFTTLNIEAYPDPAPPIVEIIAQRPGQSPEEMERYFTIPIEIAVASTPGLRYIRSNTVYALSFIRLQFEYGRDYHFARQQTINRLREADLPQGVQPVISPAGTISEIFRYELKGPPDMDVMELKTLQDWVVERRLRMVPGVADVLVLGGKTKEFQAEIDLTRMRAFGVSIPQIINAIATNNANVGGRTIAMGEQAVNVRGVGIVRSLEDIGNIVLSQQSGVPVLAQHDIADIFQRSHNADAADIDRLFAHRDRPAADIGVVGGDRVDDLRYRNSKGPHPIEVDLGLKLLGLAAEHQHVGHSRHHAQPSLHHPVLQRLELHHVHVGRPFELVTEDLADGPGWRDHRLHALRQVGLAQAIYCLLAYEVVVAAVFELQPNETERIDRVGADVSECRRTGDRDLERDRDVTFHLLGRLTWPLRDDLDDRGRGIGIGRDVECGEGYKAKPEKRTERDQHERATQ